MSDLFPIPHATRPMLEAARNRLEASMVAYDAALDSDEPREDLVAEIKSARMEVSRLEAAEINVRRGE